MHEDCPRKISRLIRFAFSLTMLIIAAVAFPSTISEVLRSQMITDGLVAASEGDFTGQPSSDFAGQAGLGKDVQLVLCQPSS